MTARELDAAVAEKVMDRHWHVPGHIVDIVHCERECKNCGNMIAQSEWYDQAHWTPSTNIAAAWEVVEKMRSEGFNVSIESLDESDGQWWNVAIGEAMVDKKNVKEAICLAALEATAWTPT